MRERARWALGPALALLVGLVPGCSSSKPETAGGQPVTITPAMEKMKNEMMQNYKNKSLSKASAGAKK